MAATKFNDEALTFYKQVDKKRIIDESFALESDEPLTDEEIRQIDEYWGKYKFAYPNIDYKSFQTFKNRCGRFDVRHCPGAIRTEYLSKSFIDHNYLVAFQHKGMLQFLYENIPQPQNLLRQMNGVLLDGNYNPVSLDEAADIIAGYSEQESSTGVVFKRNMSSGGKGVQVFKGRISQDIARKTISDMGLNAFVAQECLIQSPFMDRLNSSSVNTIRITTLLWKKKSIVLAALIRIGGSDSSVDNWCSGGKLLGVDKDTGKCNKWALFNDLSRSSVLPSGVDLEKEELYVPNFDRVKELVTAAHYRNPYIRMISWDIALDKDNMPTLIECNFGGMIQIHEATTGPLFGEYMTELLDQYLLKDFYLKFSTDEFNCKEYSDHIVISKYIGESDSVTIPETIRDKKVTYVEKKAFEDSNALHVSADNELVLKSKAAFEKIPKEQESSLS